MKVINISIFCLIVFASLSQNNSAKIILKKLPYGEVYITEDKTLKQYKWLVPEDINTKTIKQYKDGIQYLRTFHDFSFKKIDLKSLIKKWSPLHIYKGKYYVYSPSDWISHFAFTITDSVIINHGGEGPEPLVIKKYKKVSNSEFQFEVYDLDSLITTVRIRIIDIKKQIALWEFKNKSYYRRELMVNAAYVNSFPMVVTDCHDRKCILEFAMDKIDNKWLKAHGL